MKFRPCIDLHDGKVKQIVGGTLSADGTQVVENFVADQDAAYYAEMFKRDELTGGHVIMLGAGNQAEARKALNAYSGGFQIGGGINPANAAAFLEEGASHVIVTSYIFPNKTLDMGRLNELIAEVGRERLVLDVSCRRRDGAYYVVIDRWQSFTDLEISQKNLIELSNYCAEFLVHGVDVEGKRQGIQEDLVAKLGEWATIPTTYAGGVRSLADMDLMNKLGQGRLDITVGSALDIFGGDLKYQDVVKWKA
jgi:phosphoribosylformimino-5-aminoimidazole carboxamide ribotide isomerase